MAYLLDTVIIIDHLNRISAATSFILKHKKSTAISLITRAEVLSGTSAQNLAATKLLLDYFPLLSITVADADLAAYLRQQYRWKLPDALQAAIAKNNKLKLSTRNTKDFKSHQHTFITIPYEL